MGPDWVFSSLQGTRTAGMLPGYRSWEVNLNLTVGPSSKLCWPESSKTQHPTQLQLTCLSKDLIYLGLTFLICKIKGRYRSLQNLFQILLDPNAGYPALCLTSEPKCLWKLCMSLSRSIPKFPVSIPSLCSSTSAMWYQSLHVSLVLQYLCIVITSPSDHQFVVSTHHLTTVN